MSSLPWAVIVAAAVLYRFTVSGAPPVGSIPTPALPASSKPNIIFILADDLGFDDFGFANPKYLSTPNMDKFVLEATRFDNFYVACQCAQTRSGFLTGRHHVRTGTMLVNGGCDFINPAETSIAQVMAAAGYTTAQYGKWHNADVLGYTPLDMGFNTSWNPAVNKMWRYRNVPKYSKELIRIDNRYELLPVENGTFELAENLNRQVMKYLLDREQKQLNPRKLVAEDSQPFFLYYPLNAVHIPHVYPDRFKEKFFGPNRDSKYSTISQNTLDSWAYVEYLDDVMGALFEYLNQSTLRNNTFIFFGSDNGPNEQPIRTSDESYPIRLPTGMVGAKSLIYEGGIRTLFAAQGPGVQSGVIDSTLLDITDLMPTFADLAGINASKVATLPLDGISFKEQVVPDRSKRDRLRKKTTSGSAAKAAIRREDELASAAQKERIVFGVGPRCWDPDAIATLGPNREVDRKQSLLNYDHGGMMNRWFVLRSEKKAYRPGFQQCLVARYKEYKWHGIDNKVYRFSGSDHREVRENEVTGVAADKLAAMF